MRITNPITTIMTSIIGMPTRGKKRLLDDGVITQSEFEAKKAELLREL